MDQIDLARQKRGMKALAFMVIFVIFISVIIFFWGNIDKGRIKLIGEAPFNVEVFGVEQLQCQVSPCLITQRTGSKNLIITKSGFKSILIDTKVKLWSTVEEKFDFEIIPTLTKTNSMPENTSVEYDLVFDQESNLQKLIKSSDKGKRALVYLNKALENYQIFGDKNYAAIISNENLYKIDIRAKIRDKISKAEFASIIDGKWSKDGRFFSFSRAGFVYPFLMDTKDLSIKQLSLISTVDQIAWTSDSRLFFTTRQSFNAQSDDTVDLLAEESEQGISFGAYHPLEDEYKLFKTFSQITKVPEKINITSNGDSIYFKVGEEIFKIVLKRF